MSLASKWRFKKGDRKYDSCSAESENKNKLSWGKDRQKPERHTIQTDESIDHVISGRSKLAQKEHKIRYENVSKLVHYKLARKCNFEMEIIGMNRSQKAF